MSVDRPSRPGPPSRPQPGLPLQRGSRPLPRRPGTAALEGAIDPIDPTLIAPPPATLAPPPGDAITSDPISSDAPALAPPPAVTPSPIPAALPSAAPSYNSGVGVSLAEQYRPLAALPSAAPEPRVDGSRARRPGPPPHPVKHFTPGARRKLRETWWFWVASGAVVFTSLSVVAVALLLKVPALPNCPAIFWPLASASMRLYCAEIAANKRTLKDLYEAIDLISGLPPDHELRAQVDRYLKLWVEDVVNLAEQVFEAGNLKEAIAAIERLPPTVPNRVWVLKQMAEWKKIWAQAEAAYNGAKAAVVQRDWNQAFGLANKLATVNNKHWSSVRRDELITLILETREDERRLQRAIALAAKGGLSNFQAALALLEKISPQRQLGPDAAKQRLQLSDRIFATARNRLLGGDPTAAIALLDLLTASEAGSSDPKTGGPSGEQIADLRALAEAEHSAQGGTAADLESAIAAAAKIGSDRPLWQQAQSLIGRWQREIGYVTLFEQASKLAARGDTNGLVSAIAEVQKIPANSLKSTAAREAVGRWSGELQERRDRPRLQRADEYAAAGGLSGLQAGISEALAIPKGSPLYADARDRIGRWTEDLQRLQDEPILERARQYAEAGDYRTALGLAGRIGRGRPLWSEAQSLASLWREQLGGQRELADRAGRSSSGNADSSGPDSNGSTNTNTNGRTEGSTAWGEQLLRLAQQQASQGDYAGAIATAGRVPPGSPLYGSAQGQIATWEAARALSGSPTPGTPTDRSSP